jgi:hypothetical protein
MEREYTNLFYSKALQNLPDLGFLVWKYTIWQPCKLLKYVHNDNVNQVPNNSFILLMYIQPILVLCASQVTFNSFILLKYNNTVPTLS